GYIALCAGEPEHVIQREWRSSFVRHASQTDSFNCGIFCLIFAEKHMTGAADSLVHITLADLNIMRRKVAKKVMVFEVFLTGCCPKCGMTVDDDIETIPCADCGRSYHFTNYCVEADVERLGDGERFRCTLCRMNYWPRVLRQQQRATNTNQSNFQDYESLVDQGTAAEAQTTKGAGRTFAREPKGAGRTIAREPKGAGRTFARRPKDQESIMEKHQRNGNSRQKRPKDVLSKK
ncbi:hypothetical protein MAR_019020, partial [Mya arenaria]